MTGQGLLRPAPHSIVIFGGSGDLTQRKVMPALYDLYVQDLLPDVFSIVGYSRTSMSDEEFRSKMKRAVASSARQDFSESRWNEMAPRIFYVSGDYSREQAMSSLRDRLEEIESGSPERLFYCATPPSAFESIACRIGEIGLADRSRIVIEKPFGNDLKSACKLNEVLHAVFQERQVLRIDHYLGKETVQNILVMRFSNGMFEPIWNRRYVSSVQIDVAESTGIGDRGKFYEGAGAVRDIVQNHMMQLVSILMMEPPASFDAESIRDEKVKLLRAMPHFNPENVVRGQYVAGKIEGESVPGYRQESDVDADSFTETFVAIRAEIENWRWAGVPIYLRTGKRMPRRATTITVVFKDAPHLLFEESGLAAPSPNHLTIRIQPDEGITLTFDAKVPGPEMQIAPVNMSFDYDTSFMKEPAEAYERLIYDAMVGDSTLFTRADEIERAWQIVEPILPHSRPEFYEAGSWGPSEADELIAPGTWYLSDA